MQTISVVVLARTDSLPVLRTLEALARLKDKDRLQVIVVNCCGPAAQKRFAEQFPAYQVVNVPATWTSARARSAGVAQATGEIVVMLSERYGVDDAWLAAIGEAHRQDVDVVGGPVAQRLALNNAEWAMYIAEYAHSAPPVEDGILDLQQAMMLPGGNISYKRHAFEMVSMQDYLWELDFHAALQRAGARFLRCRKMCASFASPYTVTEGLTERRRVSRELAALRVRGMSAPARCLLALSWLPLPAVLTLRIMRRALAKPGLRRAVWPALPWIIRYTCVQTAAEIKGILPLEPGVAPAGSETKPRFLN